MSEEGTGSIGSSFEDFLKEEGIHEEVTAEAVKCVLAWQTGEAMWAERITLYFTNTLEINRSL